MEYVVLHSLYFGPILPIAINLFLLVEQTLLKVIKDDVPQGSVLGPFLFLFAAILNSDVHHLADDTNLINTSSSLKQLAKQMNLDFEFLSHWLNANKISLNASKTEHILFKHARKPLLGCLSMAKSSSQ